MNPESRFRQAVHRHLPAHVYHESAKALMSNGTPDDYYESKEGHCRIEYKHYPKCPPRAGVDLTKPEKDPKLSALQQEWLKRAYDNGQPVYVIVGFESGHDMWGVVFHDPVEWLQHWDKDELEKIGQKPKELAKYIENHLIGYSPQTGK